MKNIFLYGPPGVGKSAVGSALADILGLSFIDLDSLIESRTGDPINVIFSKLGESVFRKIEKELLFEISSSNNRIIALGGGSLLDPDNRQRAEETGTIILLDATYETLVDRMVDDSGTRPLLSGDYALRLRALLDDREVHYQSFNKRIQADNKSITELVWELQVLLGRFRLTGMGSTYDVIIAKGSLQDFGRVLREKDINGKIILVSDENVAHYYLETVYKSLVNQGFDVNNIILQPGEKNKTINTIISLWESFVNFGIDRQSVIIALGGGVIGDITGFAAATILRGVQWINIPTSLLAMCDASIGGKTGADLPFGKNLIGAFYPPGLVFVDPETLITLPDDEIRNGMAEVAKHGVIADSDLLDISSKGLEFVKDHWDKIIRRAMAVKIQIIEQDPYDKGKRAVLNLGHTLGHALEAASDYEIRHGEAVAIGMVYASLLSEGLGIAEKNLTLTITNILKALGLPVTIPHTMEQLALLRLMQVDKKRKHDKPQLVLPRSIGDVIWGIEVNDDVLIEHMQLMTEKR